MSLQQELGNPNGLAAPVTRVGTVVATPAPTASVVWVQMAAGQEALDLPYVAGYVPVSGDKVEIVFQSVNGSMQGIVVGGQASQSGNMVVNPNFYRAPALEFPPVNNPPYHWFRYVASGNAAVVCQTPHLTYQRLMMVMSAVGGVSSGDTYAYSSAIPVTAGATYNLRTMGRVSNFVLTTLTAQSRVAWFTAADQVYPNYMAENQFGSDVVGAGASTDIFHFGAVAAPALATFARIALRANHVGTGAGSGSSTYWSEVAMLRA